MQVNDRGHERATNCAWGQQGTKEKDLLKSNILVQALDITYSEQNNNANCYYFRMMTVVVVSGLQLWLTKGNKSMAFYFIRA